MVTGPPRREYFPTARRAMQGVRDAPGNIVNATLGYDVGTMTHKGGMYWVWLSIFLCFADWTLLGFNGIDFRNVLLKITNGGLPFIIGVIFNLIVLVLLAFYIFFGKHSKEEILNFSIAVIMTSLILTMVNFNGASLIHLAFAWFMWHLLFKEAMPKQDANLMLAVILFIDFFAFSIIATFNGASFVNRLIIPVHFFFSLNYTRESAFKSVLVAIVIIVYLSLVSATLYTMDDFTEQLTNNDKITAKQTFMKAYDNLVLLFTQTKAGVTASVNDYVNDTKNDLQGTSYTTEIDAKSKQDLGVELADVGRDDLTRYNTGDTIRITGILEGRNIDDFDKIDVFVTCYGRRSIDSKNRTNGTVLGKEVYKISIGLYEEQFIDCEIKNASRGDWTIYFEALFNFTSEGYLKTYYMDKDRYISLRSQDIDVFENYDIRDTRPVSKSINGPAKIGIVTGNPPGLIPYNKSETFTSYVGVSLTNNWNGGKLNKVWDIKLTIPYGLELTNCNDRFYNEYSDSGLGESSYSLMEGYIQKTFNYTIDDVRSEKCSLNLTDREELLGSSPFSTRYFKAESTYEYLLKKSVAVTVHDQK